MTAVSLQCKLKNHHPEWSNVRNSPSRAALSLAECLRVSRSTIQRSSAGQRTAQRVYQIRTSRWPSCVIRLPKTLASSSQKAAARWAPLRTRLWRQPAVIAALPRSSIVNYCITSDTRVVLKYLFKSCLHLGEHAHVVYTKNDKKSGWEPAFFLLSGRIRNAGVLGHHHCLRRRLEPRLRNP